MELINQRRFERTDIEASPMYKMGRLINSVNFD